MLSGIRLNRGQAFWALLVLGWMCFEAFNYATNAYGLVEFFGDFAFLGVKWAHLLAIAFVTIDFGGLARLITPEQGRSEPQWIKTVFVIWLIGAIANGFLTWWSVSLAMQSHPIQTPATGIPILRLLPIAIAVSVFCTRVALINLVAHLGETVVPNRPRVTSIPSPAPVQIPSPTTAASIPGGAIHLPPIQRPPVSQPAKQQGQKP